MTTYPNCGAPQIAKKPVKPRFEKLVLFALGADLVTIIGTFIFFNYIWMKSSSHHDPVSLALYNTLLLAMVLVTAAGPVLGLILSIVGLTRTRSKGTKGKPLNLTEAIIMGAIDGFIKGSLTLVLALAAEAIGFLLVVSIIIGVFGLCAGLIDVDCGIHLLMDKDKTNDAWGYYYIIFGSLDTAWALYGIINDSIEFGK